MIEDYTGIDPEDWGSVYDALRLRVEIAKLRNENSELKARILELTSSPDDRNKLILDAINRRTKELLSMPQEDLKEYLESRYDV